MRDYMLTFLSDDVDKIKVFNALHDAGLREFVITEGFGYNIRVTGMRNDMDVSENSTVSKKEKVKTCADCKYFGFSTVFSRTSETQYLCTLKSEDEKRYVTSVCVGFEVREDEYKQQICEKKPSEQGE